MSSLARQMAMLGSPETQKHPDSRSLGKREGVTLQPPPTPTQQMGTGVGPLAAGPGSKHSEHPLCTRQSSALRLLHWVLPSELTAFPAGTAAFKSLQKFLALTLGQTQLSVFCI